MSPYDGETGLAKAMKQHMYDNFVTRYDEIMSVLNIAAFLDPRYRSLSFSSEEERQSVILAVENETISIHQSNAVALEEPKTPCGQPPKKLRGESALLELVCDIIEPSCSKDTTDVVVAEVRRYAGEIQVKEKPLRWWHFRDTYPNFLLARKYLSVSATSVPCERAFSTAGHIVNRKRGCLLPESVHKLVFLSENLN